MYIVLYLAFSILVGYHAKLLGKNGILYCLNSIIFSPISVLIFLVLMK